MSDEQIGINSSPEINEGDTMAGEESGGIHGKSDDLELMRLRVLASVRRSKSSSTQASEPQQASTISTDVEIESKSPPKEEGEVSEEEDRPPPPKRPIPFLRRRQKHHGKDTNSHTSYGLSVAPSTEYGLMYPFMFTPLFPMPFPAPFPNPSLSKSGYISFEKKRGGKKVKKEGKVSKHPFKQMAHFKQSFSSPSLTSFGTSTSNASSTSTNGTNSMMDSSRLSEEFLVKFSADQYYDQDNSLSRSFDPQNIIITLDSCSEDGGDPIIAVASPGLLSTMADDSAKIAEDAAKRNQQCQLIGEELERLEGDLAQLNCRYGENETLIKLAVEKQAKLKSQLRATKEVIHRGKGLRQSFLETKSQMEAEFGKKKELLRSLNLDMNLTRSIPSLETNSLLTEDFTRSEQKKSSALVELEKQALKLKKELMEAQISLLHRQNAQKKSLHLLQKIAKKAGRIKTLQDKRNINVVGKILSKLPIKEVKRDGPEKADSEPSAPPADGVKEVVINEILSKSFPKCLHSIGGHLMSSELLNMILSYCSTSKNADETSFEDINQHDINNCVMDAKDQLTVHTVGGVSWSPDAPFFEAKSQGATAANGTTFKTYESPLKCFKSYRLSPSFMNLGLSQGLLSRTFTNQVDPMTIICNDDLAGRCTRPGCSFQHFRTIFLPDVLVLGDFLKYALLHPIKAPFTDYNGFLLCVSKELKFKMNNNQPLVSLVYTVLEAFSSQGHPYYISFEMAKSNAKLESAMESILGPSHKQIGVEIPYLNVKPRTLLKGHCLLQNGHLPGYDRYFDKKEGMAHFASRIESNPQDCNAYIELFLLQLASEVPLGDAIDTLRRGLAVNIGSELLWIIFLCSVKEFSPYEEAKAFVKDFASQRLAFPFVSTLLFSFDKSYEEVVASSLFLLFLQPQSSGDLVDLVHSIVKLICDAGHPEDALALLYFSIFQKNLPSYDGPFGESKLTHLQMTSLSATGRADLFMLYVRLRDVGTYPHELYMNGTSSFFHIQRTDCYFIHDWGSQHLTVDSLSDDLELLQGLLLDLLNEDPKGNHIPWLLCNLFERSKSMGLAARESLPANFSIEDISAAGRAMVLFYLLEEDCIDTLLYSRGSPLELLTLLAFTEKYQRGGESLGDFLKALIVAFWRDLLGSPVAEDDLIKLIPRLLGCSEDVNIIENAPDVRLSPEMLSDWALWLLSSISLSLFGCRPDFGLMQSAVQRLNSPSAQFAMIFCISLSNSLNDPNVGLDKNVLPRVEYYLGEYGKSQPVSRVLGYWQSILPVPLEGAVADFLDLNLEESNRIVDIFIDLVTEFPPAKRMVSSDLVSGQSLLNLLTKTPTEPILWILVLDKFRPKSISSEGEDTSSKRAFDRLCGLCSKFLPNPSPVLNLFNR